MSEFRESHEFLLHKVIEEFLANKNMSLRELALLSKIPYSTIYSWSIGGKPKDISKLKQLSNTLGISLDDLIFNHSKEKKKSHENEVIKLQVEVIIKKA